MVIRGMRVPLRLLAGRILDAWAAAAAAVLRPLDVRFLNVRASRIGEVGVSLGYFVEEGALGWRKRVRGVFIAFPDQRWVSNRCYLRYWKRYVRVVTNPLVYRLAFRVAQRPGMVHPVRNVALPRSGREVFVDRAVVLTHPLWERQRRGPLLKLEADHARRGREVLRGLGMGPDDWFVSVHAREGAFFAEDEDSGERHRNASIATYVPAMLDIVGRGGWVVRVGDPTMTPLPPLEHVIDYPHTDVHADWMDVYLAASCRFFLGCSSGLFVVAWSFGRPCALANWHSIMARPWSAQDLYIPKLRWLEAESRFLTFREELSSEFRAREWAENADADDLQRAGLRLVDNSPDEIVELVDEMFASEEGVPRRADHDRLQLELEKLLMENGYGTAARMGSEFLRRHADLLFDAAAHGPCRS
jgi:putative glycosyltransferase (TIGR04372 family)